jgi:N6-L-threonylcarbamoyladenine synthase
MKVLGIETSCDETGVAVVENGVVRSDIVASQIDIHARFGGVVPELASRAHVSALVPTVERALREADTTLDQLDGIAVTVGPGLAGALLAGVAHAKAMASALRIPLLGVHHLHGHVEAAFLHEPKLEVPLVALIVSGGHSMVAHVTEIGHATILGETVDDAAGEAFDKIARFIGLGFPGGPLIDKLAKEGDPTAIRFPRPLTGSDTLDMSFSGLKTAVIRWVRERAARGEDFDAPDLAASFQEAIVDVMVDRAIRAARETGAPTIIASGGVAANSRLRARLEADGTAAGFDVVIPPLRLCTDNGAMIAAAGARLLERGEFADPGVGIDPGLAFGAPG